MFIVEPQQSFANFWVRGIASLIDEVITTVPSYFLGELAVWLLSSIFDVQISVQMKSFVGFAAGFFISIPYHIAFLPVMGWTPGKRLFNLVVVDYKTKKKLSWKQSFFRYLAQIVSMVPLGAGYLMALFDPEKRALHDLIAGTIVYKENKTGILNS